MGTKEVNTLSVYETCELVEELKKRDAIETTIIKPDERWQLHVDGPAVVLVVYD